MQLNPGANIKPPKVKTFYVYVFTHYVVSILYYAMILILKTCFSLQTDVKSEVAQLRKEVETTLSMYKQACEELVHKQTQVRSLVFSHVMDS